MVVSARRRPAQLVLQASHMFPNELSHSLLATSQHRRRTQGHAVSVEFVVPYLVATYPVRKAGSVYMSDDYALRLIYGKSPVVPYVSFGSRFYFLRGAAEWGW